MWFHGLSIPMVIELELQDFWLQVWNSHHSGPQNWQNCISWVAVYALSHYTAHVGSQWCDIWLWSSGKFWVMVMLKQLKNVFETPLKLVKQRRHTRTRVFVHRLGVNYSIGGALLSRYCRIRTLNERLKGMNVNWMYKTLNTFELLLNTGLEKKWAYVFKWEWNGKLSLLRYRIHLN